MLKICALASGSKGNSVLVSNERTQVLVDCGISARELKRRMAQVGCGISDISALLITHEHTDHVTSISELSCLYGIPLFIHHKTYDAVLQRYKLGANIQLFDTDCGFDVGGINILPFELPHDAVRHVGFRMDDRDSALVYATDLGHASSALMEAAKGTNLAFLESNHDLDMLLNGVYPPFLKRRIASNVGHLSNDMSARAAFDMLKFGVRNFVLAHLSEQNNLQELAELSYSRYFEGQGASIYADCTLKIAGQWEPSGFVLAKKD